MIHLIKKTIRILPKIISGFLIVAFMAMLNGSSGNPFSNNIFAPKIAEAAFNTEINYQGKLTNTSNVAVADGNYIMKFRLYTATTGATTTNIWEEIRTATGDKAVVSNGLFSVLLGSSTPFTTVNFNQTLYLGVEVCGTVGLSGCDDEMTPRKKLGAVPAAFQSDKIDGLSSEQFLRSDAVNSTSTATTFLTITQNSTGKIAEFIGPNAFPVFSILSGGNVGVGTTSPWAKLSINSSTNDTAGQPLFVIASSTATATTTQFIVTNAGKVGIGSTTPSAMLSITGVTPASPGDADNVLSVFGGAGGAGGGGAGGGIVLVAGNASAAVSSNGFLGGAVTISSGAGGLGGGMGGAGGAGGAFSITTGAGGAGGVISGVGGNGGNIELTTGAGATAGGGADGAYGNIILVKNGGNVGVGTTSPYAKLSVAGKGVFDQDIRANYYTATSTTIASTFPYASTTGLTVSGTGGLYVGTLTGPLQAINGAVTASSTISVAYGGTGLSTAPSYGDLLVGNATGGYTLTATSSLGIAFANIVGTLGVSQGGTGAATFGQGWIFSSGGTGALSASTSPTVNYLTSTSTTATSTFAYDTSINGRLKVIQSGTSATIIGDTTGNARGTSALDIQSTRSVATQVSSGSGSIAIGASNISSGEAGLAFGISNSAVALNAITFGNRNFSASDGYASVVMGVLNNQTGGVLDFTTGAITGTALSSISVGRLSSAVGLLNTVTGNFGQAFGFNNTVSGVGSSAFGSFITNSIASSTQIGSDNTSKIVIRGDTGFEGFVGIGTSTPAWGLSSYSATAPQLALSASAGVSQWTFRNAGGNLYFATTTTAGTATSSLSAFTIINSTNNVGIGTTNPASKLQVHGNIGLESRSKIVDVSNTNKYIQPEDGSGYGTWNGFAGLRFVAAYSNTNSGLTYGVGHKFTSTYSASSGNQYGLAITPIYNQTGTASGTDLLINRTQNTVGSGGQLLIDAQVNGITKFNVSNTGVVGIATSSPWRTLSVVGTVAFNGLTSSSVGNAVCIATTKDIIDAGGTVCTTSSLRFKENVKTLDEGFAIDTLNQLRVVSFDYKKGVYSPEDRKESYGLIAEEVERIDPNLVDYGYDGKPLTLKFEKILGLAIQAIQEMGRERAFSQGGNGGGGGEGGWGMTMGSILENLKNLGADIAEGLAYFKGLIVETLTVGSPEKPTGITLYDEITGKPYCVKISNGKLKNISGKCEDVSEPADEPKDNTVSSGGGTTSSTTSSTTSLPALLSETEPLILESNSAGDEDSALQESKQESESVSASESASESSPLPESSSIK